MDVVEWFYVYYERYVTEVVNNVEDNMSKNDARTVNKCGKPLRYHRDDCSGFLA